MNLLKGVNIYHHYYELFEKRRLDLI